MSATEQRPADGKLKETERIEPDPAARPRAVRRRDGRPEGQRLQAQRQAPGGADGAEKNKAIRVVILAVASVGLMTLGRASSAGPPT